jgi:mannose-6-phosphate isomerase-like protein (cupin superfamily)
MNKEHRPWGYYETIVDEPNHKVKRITIEPGKRISLQSHNKREEHWIHVSGNGIATLGEALMLTAFNSNAKCIYIPKGTIHRLSASLESPLVFIEVQTGDYFGEDDIIRYSDDYGRV